MDHMDFCRYERSVCWRQLSWDVWAFQITHNLWLLEFCVCVCVCVCVASVSPQRSLAVERLLVNTAPPCSVSLCNREETNSQDSQTCETINVATTRRKLCDHWKPSGGELRWFYSSWCGIPPRCGVKVQTADGWRVRGEQSTDEWKLRRTLEIVMIQIYSKDHEKSLNLSWGYWIQSAVLARVLAV